MHRFSLKLALSVIAGFVWFAAVPTADAQEAAVAPATEEQLTEWKALTKQKAAFTARMKELNDAFPSAGEEDRKKLASEAQSLVAEFRQKMAPRLSTLAPAVYARNPQDVDAAEVMMQMQYQRNRFDLVAQAADTVLKAQPNNQLALNLSGAAHFAIHDFAKAAQLLDAAEKGPTFQQIGAPFQQSAHDYVEYWQKEQAIRQKEAAATGDEQLPRVLLKTPKGDILLELFENEAPNTVANFVNLVETKFYDGTKFHRVIPGFMAQGGDPNTKPGAFGQPGTGGPGYTIACECYRPDARRHFAGTLSMAHAGKDTGGSQFFITHLPTPHLDKEVRPESVHTVFGRVVKGMDIVAALEADDVIEAATVVRKRNHEYTPKTGPPKN